MATEWDAVRLNADGYSKPRGSIGVVTERHEQIGAYTIAWIGGSSSTPVAYEDVESLGPLRLPLVGEPASA